MNHDEIRSLLGAYALDAVTADEHDTIAEHLTGCAACADEVATHYEAAAIVASAISRDTPPPLASAELWDRIERETRDDAVVTALAPRREASLTRSRTLLAIVSVAAALLLVAVIALEVQVGNLNTHVAAIRSTLHASNVEAQLAATLLSPDHRTVSMVSTRGVLEATAVIGSNGVSYFVNQSLSPVGSSSTFQLWALSNNKVVSLGVLGGDPHVVAFRIEPTMTELLVNVEPLGGTPAPTTPVQATGSLTSA